MNDIRLAWRNIWRNKRRTLLTAASIFLAIFLALIVRSLQIGWFDNLTKIVVQSYTGHIQIHRKGYWDDRDINNSIVFNDSLTALVSAAKNVDKTVPRLEYFALSSFGKQTKGVMLSGTDPAREDALTSRPATRWCCWGRGFMAKVRQENTWYRGYFISLLPSSTTRWFI